MEGPWKRLELEGRIVYDSAVVDVPSSKIDTDLKELLRKTVEAIGGPEPASKVASWGECRYCDISRADCPERIEIIPKKATSSHDLF